MEHNATASCPSSISVPWKKESALPFETSETFHQTTRRHISEHNIIHSHHLHNLKSNALFFDVLLTVHLSIILAINQLNAQNLLL